MSCGGSVWSVAGLPLGGSIHAAAALVDRAFVPAASGMSCHLRPLITASSPPRLAHHPPSCFRNVGTPFCRQCSRTCRAQSSSIGLALGPVSPLTITYFTTSPNHFRKSSGPRRDSVLTKRTGAGTIRSGSSRRGAHFCDSTEVPSHIWRGHSDSPLSLRRSFLYFCHTRLPSPAASSAGGRCGPWPPPSCSGTSIG